MKTIEKIIETLESKGIKIYEYKEGQKLCGYELNTYSEGGVNMIVFLDFRHTGLSPKNRADFLKIWNQYFENFDIDEEIETLRQDKRYVEAFSLTDSVTDFTNWKTNLENLFSTKSAQERQFEQVKDKFLSLLAQMEETLKLMPLKGDNPATCQRITISNQLGGLDHCINGIELEDFTPNEFSGEFNLSYS